MTLPSGGPLSFGDIQGEFGGGTPLSLSNYYSGGSNVIAGTQGAGGTIPSGGQISFHNFYGSTHYNDNIILTSGMYSFDFYGDPYNEYNQIATGFHPGYSIGSISPVNSSMFGTPWTDLYFIQNKGFGGAPGGTLLLGISGATNSGWTTMTIYYAGGGFSASYNRADAAFGGSEWTWNLGEFSNPFVDGSSQQVTFT